MPRKKTPDLPESEPTSDAWQSFKKFRAEVELFAKIDGKIDGAVETYHEVILRFGEHFFGTKAPKEIQARVKAITNLILVRCVAERLLEVKSWDELVDLPGLPDHFKPGYVPRHAHRTENRAHGRRQTTP